METPFKTARKANTVIGISGWIRVVASIYGAMDNHILLNVATENINMGLLSGGTISPVHVVRTDSEVAFASFSPMQNIISNPTRLISFTIQRELS